MIIDCLKLSGGLMVAVVGDGMYQRRNRIRDFYLHVKQGLMDNRLFENGNEYIFSAQIFAWLDGWKSQLEVSLLAALRFYAGGSYQTDIGVNKFVSISQQSVSRSIKEVTDALNRPQILNRFIKFPQDIQELNSCRRKFYEKFGFPGVVGCIDCTHVAIVPPPGNNPEMPERAFVNRKGYHSINVQLICDSNAKILNIVAAHAGNTHDSFIWTNCEVERVMRQIHGEGRSNYYLLGDSGYPLRPWLLTSFNYEPAPDTPEYRYNVAHKSVRSIIERCNGILKARFRCCLKDRVLHYKPEMACKIINACAVLHNLCTDHHMPVPEDEEVIDVNDGLIQAPPLEENERAQGRINPELVAGRNTRARLIRARFQ
ncbi:hypothetical protein Zmor_009944 [Zophobas morio]|uniref:DDE Tnp4 domain-containing protein n=1 Tax=Zophobas morio TaxID=2755281 RepID=A0AA38IN89_9CUCU|nr:hypothetical protein Zmor_009944 [Zophobas morio]